MEHFNRRLAHSGMLSHIISGRLFDPQSSLRVYCSELNFVKRKVVAVNALTHTPHHTWSLT